MFPVQCSAATAQLPSLHSLTPDRSAHVCWLGKPDQNTSSAASLTVTEKAVSEKAKSTNDPSVAMTTPADARDGV
jgi:hypothetical protein